MPNLDKMKPEQKPLSELSENELAKEFKNRKTQFYTSCVFIGFLIGISLYSTFVNGFGILTFLPVPFFAMGGLTGRKYKEIQSELQRRKTT